MPRKTTRTSDFGTAGRISHDATAFYTSRLYEGLPVEDAAPAAADDLPPAAADRIFCASSEQMQDLPDHSVHLMVTSPPYNVGKQYDEDLTLAEYRAFLRVSGPRSSVCWRRAGAPASMSPTWGASPTSRCMRSSSRT